MNENPRVAITMGDPSGIGPEVTVKALADGRVYEKCRAFVIGSIAAVEDALNLIKTPVTTRMISSPSQAIGQLGTIDVLDLGNLKHPDIQYGQVSEKAGKASVDWVIQAGNLALTGQIQAVVTAPINKEACNLAGYKDIGHMEIFKRQAGATEVATMLIAGSLRVVHLTTHRSLRMACEYVSRDNVLAMINLTHQSFQRWGFPRPKIAVAALNPHASDGGLIGDEEQLQISPAVEEAQALGIYATGPVAADTVFNQAIDGNHDVVIAMYHDQGHIPIKIHDWARSISVNLGLPFIRTSVDHGTAFDIAGKGLADHKSMLKAIEVAVGLASEGRLI